MHTTQAWATWPSIHFDRDVSHAPPPSHPAALYTARPPVMHRTSLRPLFPSCLYMCRRGGRPGAAVHPWTAALLLCCAPQPALCPPRALLSLGHDAVTPGSNQPHKKNACITTGSLSSSSLARLPQVRGAAAARTTGRRARRGGAKRAGAAAERPKATGRGGAAGAGLLPKGAKAAAPRLCQAGEGIAPGGCTCRGRMNVSRGWGWAGQSEGSAVRLQHARRWDGNEAVLEVPASRQRPLLYAAQRNRLHP